MWFHYVVLIVNKEKCHKTKNHLWPSIGGPHVSMGFLTWIAKLGLTPSEVGQCLAQKCVELGERVLKRQMCLVKSNLNIILWLGCETKSRNSKRGSLGQGSPWWPKSLVSYQILFIVIPFFFSYDQSVKLSIHFPSFIWF